MLLKYEKLNNDIRSFENMFQINNVDVSKTSHFEAVKLIRGKDEITLVLRRGSQGRVVLSEVSLIRQQSL